VWGFFVGWRVGLGGFLVVWGGCDRVVCSVGVLRICVAVFLWGGGGVFFSKRPSYPGDCVCVT